MGKPHQEIFDDTKAMEELKLDKEDLEGLGGSAPLTSKQGVETKDPQACKGWEIKSRTQAAEVAAELKERKEHTETIQQLQRQLDQFKMNSERKKRVPNGIWNGCHLMRQ